MKAPPSFAAPKQEVLEPWSHQVLNDIVRARGGPDSFRRLLIVQRQADVHLHIRSHVLQ